MSRASHIVSALASRSYNRHFGLAIATTALYCAKTVHVIAHLSALPADDVLLWGLSFYTQDACLVLFLKVLYSIQFGTITQLISLSLALFFTAIIWMLAALSCSFFSVTGTELHWRNVALASDSSSWSTLMTGMVGFVIVTIIMVVLGWLLQDVIDTLTSLALDILKWPFVRLNALLRRPGYNRLRQDEHSFDSELDAKRWAEEGEEEMVGGKPNRSSWRTAVPYLVVGGGMLLMVVLSINRPRESSLVFLSWTLPLLPLVDFSYSTPSLGGLVSIHGNGISNTWDNMTALVEPPHFKWLPNKGKEPLRGFEDWFHKNATHYNAAADPLRITNSGEDVLASLKPQLRDLDIRHVVVLKLESTRQDVFPFKKDDFIWNKLLRTWENETFPDDALERLKTLTRTANFVTGDYQDGFDRTDTPRRGGINAKDAYTTSTYTLKSLTGSLCGISPLAEDFNVEFSHHVYQPCLAHILDVFNKLKPSVGDKVRNDFTSFPWESRFMMSVTNGYDHQDALMPKLGYRPENLVHKEYLRGQTRIPPKFGNETTEDINYYGMPEVVLEKYIRDAFQTAEKDDKRLFLTHLTSTTHHPFKLPKDDPDYEFVPLNQEGGEIQVSRYLNTIGYVDRWLGKILDILEEEKVANHTLVVFVGDHGLSVAESHAVTPYYATNVGNFHVPLVFSHPKLPVVDIDDPVTSIQILPTILDMLRESSSLSSSQSFAAKDLLHNYEGQSLIRKQLAAHPDTSFANWQFSVMNPGRAQIALRDARRPHWRLIVPLVKDTEWKFSDMEADPHEKNPTQAFGFEELVHKLEKEYGMEEGQKGEEVGEWVEEAAFVVRWWSEENKKRWRYK